VGKKYGIIWLHNSRRDLILEIAYIVSKSEFEKRRTANLRCRIDREA